MDRRLAARGALEVDLDHLRRARAHEEQKLRLGAALEQPRDHTVELLVHVRDSGEVAFGEDGGREARLGEDHHARRRLDQMRAGAGADHEEEGVTDLPVQPDDAGQPAEHFALSALAQDGELFGSAGGAGRLQVEGHAHVHGAGSGCALADGKAAADALESRAARSFRTNWVALIT